MASISPAFPLPRSRALHTVFQVEAIMRQVLDDFIKEKGSEYDARKGPSAR